MSSFLDLQSDVFELQWGDAESFEQLDNRRKWAKTRHAKMKDTHLKEERAQDSGTKRRRGCQHGFSGGDGWSTIF